MESSTAGSNTQVATVTVTGISFADDTPNTLQSKVAEAVRALASTQANSSGGRGYTVGANQVLMPGWAKG